MNFKKIADTSFNIQVSTRNAAFELITVDGCATFYHIHWLNVAKVQSFGDWFVLYTSKHLQSAAVYLILNRYRDYNIKGQIILKQLGQHLRIHALTLGTRLPTNSEIHQNQNTIDHYNLQWASRSLHRKQLPKTIDYN